VVLRALREARGVTREGWAARLGYSASTVQRWERGAVAPDAAAEAALLSLLQGEGLLRPYTAGPLRGHTLTEVNLRHLLAEARSGRQPPSSPPLLQLLREPAAVPSPTPSRPRSRRSSAASRHSATSPDSSGSAGW
jgi:transcriptional regulator with XRE-family HTH domain